ncbi:hypothetical protein PC116_g27316 [Phytophthora cactorum]|nr:hypothetical protein PC116_g27316 [Phytophthora cactorum]
MAGAGETEITDPDRTPGPVVPVNGSLGDLIDLSMDDSDDETYATAANALNGSEEVLAAAEITDPVDDMAVPEDMAGAGETEITDPDRTPGPVVPVNGSLGDLIDLSMDDSDDETYATAANALNGSEEVLAAAEITDPVDDMAVPEDMAGAGETEITDPDRTPGPVVPVNGSLGDLIDLSMDDSDDETYATAANALNGSEEVLAAAEITDPVDDLAVPEDRTHGRL